VFKVSEEVVEQEVVLVSKVVWLHEVVEYTEGYGGHVIAFVTVTVFLDVGFLIAKVVELVDVTVRQVDVEFPGDPDADSETVSGGIPVENLVPVADAVEFSQG